ncbi:MAG: 50S ribosomal protein L4 [Acidobacteria bacterium]|nr:50S ribosomal protein L4 [Acidobacteriota bacterium]MCI0625698.1 50S ribosomal protein L4 [Acidobacteriota bacterium]MCI0722617.1 50S ribosomal protein L4 [Acidobacteriota bacterium]
MLKLQVKNLNNQVVGEIELNESVFAAKVNKSLVFAAVKHYLDGLRQGTHATKNRSQVSGGGKKPWRQKGTGRARVGSSRNPIWRHGGIAHGPTPRSYSFHLPKKMILGALRSALTDKYNGNAITVVEDFSLQNHKSKELRQRLNAIELNRKLLIVEAGENSNLDRASGNLAKVKLVFSRELNVYDLLNHEQILFSKAAIQKLQEALSV